MQIFHKVSEYINKTKCFESWSCIYIYKYIYKKKNDVKSSGLSGVNDYNWTCVLVPVTVYQESKVELTVSFFVFLFLFCFTFSFF